MILIPDFSVLILSFKKNFSKVKAYDKFFILSIFLFPVSLIAGPAVMEIIIFLNIFFFIFKLKEFKYFINKNLVKIFLLIYFLLILSSLASDFKLHSLKSSLFLIRFFIFYFIIYSILIKYNFIIKYLGYFYLFIIIFLIFDLFIQVVFEKNIFFIERQSQTVHAGFFGEEKVLASFIIRIAPIVISLILWSNDIKSKYYLILILLIFIFLSLFFTGERTAFIYFFILTFCTLYILKKENILNLLKISLFLLIISTIIGGAAFNNKYLFNRTIKNTYNQIYFNNKLNFYSIKHEAFAKTSLLIFKDNLFLGGGPNNYRNLYKNYDIDQNLSNHPHNFFIQCLGDLGLSGLVIYIFFLSLLIKNFFNSLFKKKYYLVFLCLSLFFYINPLFPSGNFFNNWFMGIGTFSLPFIFAFLKEKK